MIAKIAVSAATYAIDKPYSYKIPEGMTLQPGQRVQLPGSEGYEFWRNDFIQNVQRWLEQN